jgi:hypothetical protein
MRINKWMLIPLFVWFSTQTASAAIWKATGQIGLLNVDAELRDEQAPVMVFIRIENQSKLAPIAVSNAFVQMTDGKNQRLRPVTPDELVSEHLQKLRQLMPQDVPELNDILGNIQADYPQEKIVAVYGRLKQYLEQGRPRGWRTDLQNWLVGSRASSTDELREASVIVEEIGRLAENYLWPRDVAPQGIYTGLVFFEKPTAEPPSIYFQLGDKFIGTAFKLSSSK